jgi:hypothetical protein
LSAEHDEVGRIGDREDKTGGVGDKSTDEKIRQWLDLRDPGRCIDRRRHHHSGRVVRQEHRDQGADDVNDYE